VRGVAHVDAVQQLTDDPLDVGPQRLDASRRELVRNQSAQARVIRRIDGEHVLGERGAGEAFGGDVVAELESRLHVL